MKNHAKRIAFDRLLHGVVSTGVGINMLMLGVPASG